MRPRVFPAEDPAVNVLLIACEKRFNEAAGIPRGRQLWLGAYMVVTMCFNEAAGIPRGRPTRNG